MFALLLMAAVTTNVYAQDEPTQTDPVDDGYYLVGTFNNWTPSDEYALAANTLAEGEYYIHNVKLAVNDEFKVAWVEGGETPNTAEGWYPASNVKVTENGIFSIYFRPVANPDWPLVNIWLQKTASPFSLSVGESEHGTVKFFVESKEVTAAYEDDVVTVAITPADNYAVTKVTVKFSVNDPSYANAPFNLRDIETELVLEDLSDGYFFEMRAADAKVYVEYESNLNLTALGTAIEDASEFYEDIKEQEELANIAGTLLAAIQEAQGVYDNPTDQDAIDAAVTTLNQALEDAQEAVLQLLLKPQTYTVAPGKFATGFFADDRTVLEGVEGVQLLVISARDGNTLTATPVDVVPANTPFLVFNENNSEPFEIVAYLGDDPVQEVTTAPEFKGTVEAMTFSDDVWANNDIYVCTGTNFYWVMNNGQIGAHKCWIQIAKDDAPVVPSGAPALDIVIGEGTTHIDASLIDSVNDNVIYDLSGRRVANPTTGLYIMNGKKVILK